MPPCAAAVRAGQEPGSQLWNAVWSQSGSQLSARGLSWNATLSPGASAQFGFCANR